MKWNFQKIFQKIGLPDLMNRKPGDCLIGLVSHSRVAVYMVHKTSSQTKISHFASSRIYHREGELQETVARFLKDYRKKFGVQTREILLNFSIAQDLIIKNAVLPELPAGEIPQALSWQFKEEVPFSDLSECSLDWQEIRSYQDEEGTQRVEYIVTIATKQLIDSYIAACEAGDLDIFMMDCRSFSLAKVLSEPRFKTGVVLVLDIDFDEATLNIFHDGQLRFVREMPVSWQKFIQSLTEILVSEEGRLNLSEEEAEQIAGDIGIPKDEGETSDKRIKGAHIIGLMRPLLEALGREIRFSINYLSNTLGLPQPEVLFMTGIGANLKNLDVYLAKEVEIEIERLQPFPGLEYAGAGQPEPVINDILPSLGSSLPDAAEINLLPQEIKDRRAERLRRAALRIVGIVLACLLVIFHFVAQFQIRDYEKRLRTANIHLEALGEIQRLDTRIQWREKLIDDIRREQLPMEGILKEVSRLIPQAVILSDLRFSQKDRALTLSGNVMAVEKRAESVLFNFVEKLEFSDYFQDATLVSSQQSGINQIFEIQCDLIRPY